MDRTKEQWRQEFGDEPDLLGAGKIAEALRRLEAYRQCRQLFVSPAPALAQIRINALLDGKELIVPGPGLKEGFYLLRPFQVPFTKLSLAVSLKGLPLHGQLLRHQELGQYAIELLVTEALAIDARGNRLGDGNGFFDLACAILNQCGALVEAPLMLAAGGVRELEALPVDPWDVRLHALLGPQGAKFFAPGTGLPGIDWRQLSMQRIKKMTPLWKEWERAGSPAVGP